MLPTRLLALVAAAAPVATAGIATPQQVWVVDAAFGPGADFAAIQPAVDAASDGDVLLVRDGSYAGFEIDARGLTIVADVGASPAVTDSSYVRGLSAAQTATLRGLSFADAGTFSPAITVEDCVGAVWIEASQLGSAFSGVPNDVGAQVDRSDRVVLQRCAALGSTLILVQTGIGGTGLRVVESTVALHDSTATGGLGSAGALGGPGIAVFESEVFLSGGGATGGDGGDSPGQFDFGTLLFFCDGPPGAGGNGVVLTTAGSLLRRLDASAAGGAGGEALGVCAFPDAPAGDPIANPSGVVTTLSGPARSLASNSPVREGETLTLELGGEPGELALLALTLAPAPAFSPPLGAQLLVQPPVLLYSAGVVAPDGTASRAFGVPDLGLEGLTLFWQSAFVNGAGALATGGGSATVLLDAAL